MSGRARRPLLLAIALGAAMLALLLAIGGETMLAALRTAAPAPILAALLLSALLYPLAAWRWALITDALAGRPVASRWDYLRIRVLSGAGGFLAPRELAELGGRTLWLHRWRGLPLLPAAQAVMIDRLCDLLVSLAALAGPLLWLAGLLPLAGALAAMALAPLLLVLALPATLRLLGWLVGERARRLPLLGQHLASWPALPRLAEPVWRRALLLSLAKLLLVTARVPLVAGAVGLALPAGVLWLAAPLGQLAYLVAITPAGIGLYEAGWFGILGALGGEVGAIAAFVVVLRACLIASVACMAPVVMWRRPATPAAGELQRPC
jgi:uncharacterized membrane protein YbhN (UPF0104 family)